jgi:hypothetical protein
MTFLFSEESSGIVPINNDFYFNFHTCIVTGKEEFLQGFVGNVESDEWSGFFHITEKAPPGMAGLGKCVNFKNQKSKLRCKIYS